ncbi:MAG: ABC transporter permease [Psychrilyobacter sp.]|uniref:ABC transporter permease n=1 Tax=Psychrilyobacter sp. TaxID=2586924 RepID=UPI003C7785D8
MKNQRSGLIYSTPITLWLTLLFVAPTLIVIVYSFLKKGIYGGVEWIFSVDGYNFFSSSYFLKVVWNTIEISVIATVITVLIAIPTALYIATSKYKNFLLFLIIVPFWTNFLIRVYSWIALLGNNGLLNNLLMKLGLEPHQFIYNKFAVILVSVYAYLPYAILPLYSAIEKFDFAIIDAARDLGASKMKAYTKTFLPNIKPGVVTATLFTFIPALGSYAIPKLVGGNDSQMLGNIIARELTITRNWPKAAAISTILTIITVIFIVVLSKYDKDHKGGKV